MIFDTHAHYEDEAFNEDREELLASMKANGIEKIVNVASSMQTVDSTMELCSKYDFIFGALGVHPESTAELTESDMQYIKERCNDPKVVAIGEIGLDYYWDEPDREIQKKWFVRQLELAKEVKLPVIIHSRDAAKDTLDIMKAEKAEEVGGVIHCFSYEKEMAREYLDMGFYIGVGGVLTFKNARKLVEVVEYTPLDRIVTETDCPYLAPVPMRSKRNCSLYIPYVLDKIAEVKGISVEEATRQTYINGLNLYHRR